MKPLPEVIVMCRYRMIGSLCSFEVWGQGLKVGVGIDCWGLVVKVKDAKFVLRI